MHRSGRTARASNLGLSVMFVGPEDAKNYHKIVHGVRKGVYIGVNEKLAICIFGKTPDV